MITIFNRKELLITTNSDVYSNAKDDLKLAGIKYATGSKGNNFKHAVARTYVDEHNRQRVSNSGMVYMIYVHEKDYQKAVAAINKKIY